MANVRSLIFCFIALYGAKTFASQRTPDSLNVRSCELILVSPQAPVVRSINKHGHGEIRVGFVPEVRDQFLESCYIESIFSAINIELHLKIHPSLEIARLPMLKKMALQRLEELRDENRPDWSASIFVDGSLGVSLTDLFSWGILVQEKADRFGSNPDADYERTLTEDLHLALLEVDQKITSPDSPLELDHLNHALTLGEQRVQKIFSQKKEVSSSASDLRFDFVDLVATPRPDWAQKKALVRSIPDYIDRGSTVIIGYEHTESVARLDENSPPFSVYREGIRHGAVVIGYVLNSRSEVLGFRILNSWGKHYGKDGTFFIRENDLIRALNEAYSVEFHTP